MDETKDTEVEGDALPKLRTFKHDIATTLGREDVSKASIAIQEQNKRLTEVESAEKEIRWSKVLVALIAISILAGGGILGYALFLRAPENPNNIVITPRSETPMIAVQGRVRLEVTTEKSGALYDELSRKVALGGGRPNSVEEVILTRADVTLSAEEFLADLGIKAPERFVRFIGKRYMYGIYTSSGAEGFLIFEPASFGVVFAELLNWEKTLPTELYRLLAGKSLPQGESLVWSDTLLRNIDARVAKRRDGEVVLLYAFLPSKSELIIAPSEETFGEILSRLQSPPTTVQ